MIKGPVEQQMIQKSAVNYRQLDALNSSMIKLFSTDPVKFFNEFKLGRKRKDKNSAAILLGDLVDFYMLDCNGDDTEFEERFDEKFALYDDVKGSGQVFVLTDILFEITKQYTNDKDEITISFDTRFKEAFKKAQSLGKYSGKTEEKALEDFNENGITYYQTLIDNSTKIVVDMSLVDKARSICNTLLKDPFSADTWRCKETWECFNKFPIEWTFTTSGNKKISCKAELDILKINHQKKEIYLGDLKTNYDNENFEISYMKNQYFLQAGFYYLAVQEWMKEEGLQEYTVHPMEFVVADTSANNRRPVKYIMSDEDMDKALNGFSLRGIPYKGVKQLIEEISWAEDNNLWNCSKEIFDNNGLMNLDIRYDRSNNVS